MDYVPHKPRYAWRLQLWELFAITAFFAIIAWCGTQFGFTNAGFYLAFIGMGITSAAFVMLALRERKYRLTVFAFYFVLVLVVSEFLLGLFSIIIHALLTFVALIVCSWLPLRTLRVRCGIAMSLMAITFVFVTIPIRWQIQRLHTLQSEYPILSISERLKYEQDHASPHAAESLVLPAKIDSQLSKDEEFIDRMNEMRPWLTRLHDETFERFARSEGFGYVRMNPLRRIERRSPLVSISLQEKHFVDQVGWYASEVEGDEPIKHLHQTSRNDFLDPNGFGSVRSATREVIGFVEHAFHYSPNAIASWPQYTITQLELISLQKYPEPRAYVLDHLPRMDQLSQPDVRTRPLDDFESSALLRLKTEEDLIIDNSSGVLRMVGSLRAARQCLECHHGPRGQLLGAFTYRIVSR